MHSRTENIASKATAIPVRRALHYAARRVAKQASRTDGGEPPLITTVIPTRDRGDRITATVRSLLASSHTRFEVIVVDQSASDHTEAALRPYRTDPRLRYIRSTRRGTAAARNEGIRAARSELVATTDDDCEIPTGWLTELTSAFAVDRRVGVVFGNVVAAPYDRSTGFITAYVRRSPFLAQSIRDKHQVEGISACMAMRRSVWEELGGFDEMLGAGAPLRSGAETDFVIRALLAGHAAYETPSAFVVHYGFRTWDEGRLLIQGYVFGHGAVLAKQLKCGYWSVLSVLCRLAWRWAFRRPAVDIGDRVPRWLRLTSFVRGFAAGTSTPVDYAAGHYRLRE